MFIIYYFIKNTSILKNNYCRNPNDDETIWCYYNNNGTISQEYCVGKNAETMGKEKTKKYKDFSLVFLSLSLGDSDI